MSIRLGGGGGAGGGAAVANTDHTINITNFAVPSLTPIDSVFGSWVADHDLDIKSIQIFLMAPAEMSALKLQWVIAGVVSVINPTMDTKFSPLGVPAAADKETFLDFETLGGFNVVPVLAGQKIQLQYIALDGGLTANNIQCTIHYT